MLGLVAGISILALLFYLGYLANASRKTGRDIREVLKPHIVMYGLSLVTAVCALALFLSMDIYKPLKIMTTIVLGITLIFSASLTRARDADSTKPGPHPAHITTALPQHALHPGGQDNDEKWVEGLI